MAIGTSFATSFTESIPQGALGLKHGGHERVLNKTGILKAPFDCTVEEEGKWLIIKSKSGKKQHKHPRPDNFIFPGDIREFKEGEDIGTAYDTTSPIFKLGAMIALMKAKASQGSRYFEKENIITSECYAYEEGEIKYVEKKGDIEVWIGNTRYVYNPLCMYYYPEGTKIKKYQRFCSGVLDANRMIKHIDDMGCSVDEYTTIIGKLLDSNEFKKTITIKGKKMNVKEFFLNDNIDAVSWYYKRDDYYLTYYKVWEGETKECLKITFEIVDGSITNIASESVKTVIKEAIKDETENN
jgi:hypothetical protein